MIDTSIDSNRQQSAAIAKSIVIGGIRLLAVAITLNALAEGEESSLPPLGVSSNVCAKGWLDLRKGTLLAKGSETLAYSPCWGDAASCEIAVDGSRLLSNAAEEGVIAWAPSGEGCHVLTHTAGGVTYTARFAVLGDDTAAIDSGRLQADATWTAGKTWLVTGDFVVASNATLTIERGAVVKFMPGASLTVEDGGACIAAGVVFTHVNDDMETSGGDTLGDGGATVPAMGEYAIAGDISDDATTQYRYLKFAFGVGGAFGARGSLDLRKGTLLAKGSETLAYSPRWGGADSCEIAVDGSRLLSDAAEEGAIDWAPSGEGCHVLTHTAGGVTYTARFAVLGAGTVAIEGGQLQADATWTAGKTWLVTGDFVVASNAALTIERGAVVKFMPGASLTVEDGGSCVAAGVVFTHVNDDMETSGGDTLGDGGATVPTMGEYAIGGDISDDATTQYRYLKFAFGVGGAFGARGMLDLRKGTLLAKEQETITYSPLWGAADSCEVAVDGSRLMSDAAEEGVIAWAPSGVGCHVLTHTAGGVTYTARFAMLGAGTVAIEGGQLLSDATWTAGKTWLVTGDFVVASNATLTIERGTVVKFMPGASLTVEDGGACVAAGVVFTHVNDDMETSGGDTLGDGGATVPAMGEYAIAGDISDDATTQYRYLKFAFGVGGAFGARGSLDLMEGPFIAHETESLPYSPRWGDGDSCSIAVDGSRLLSDAAEEGVIEWIPEGEGLHVLTHESGTETLRAEFIVLNEAYAHDGAITEDEVWGNDKVHVVSRDVSVKDGATLTIEQGAVVKFLDGRVLTIDGGMCIAKGVIFTSIADDTVGGDTLCDGDASVPVENSYAIVGMMQDDMATEYRYGVQSYSGTLAGEVVWRKEKTYVIDGTLTVATNGVLTIPAGTVVKFTDGSALEIAPGGLCYAVGVVFTHIADDSIGGDTMGDGYETRPEYGKYTVSVDVIDSEATEYRYSAPISTSGTLNGNIVWRARQVYHVTGNLTLASGATLTIAPGSVIKFDPGVSLTVNSGATLNAQGTRSSPVVFTSIKDDEHGGDTNGDGDATYAQAGDWHQITGSGTVTLNYCRVLWGSAQNNQGALYPNGGTWQFDNSIVAHCQYDCMRSYGGEFMARNSCFVDSSMGAAPASGEATFINCVFSDLTTAVRWGAGAFYNCIFNNITEDVIDKKFYSSTVVCPFYNCCFWCPNGTGDKAAEKVGKDGNFYANPLFLDPENGDFRIAADSPCVDAGDGAVAPEKDWYGQTRQNVLAVSPTGVAAANGKYPDIGICEVMPNEVVAGVDLAAVSVTAPESFAIGDEIEVAWKVRNDGEEELLGEWTDKIELVFPGSDAVALGTARHAGRIASGAETSFSQAFRVPAGTPGQVSVRVCVNANRDVFEGTLYENNACDSGFSHSLAANTVSFGDAAKPVEVSLAAGQSYGFFVSGIEAPGALMMLSGTLSGASVMAAAARMPVAAGDSALVPIAGGGAVWISVPQGADGVYVVVRNDTLSALGGRIEMSESRFAALEFSTKSGVCGEIVQGEIYGYGFGEGLSVSIASATGDIAADVEGIAGATRARVSFDLADALPGTYDIVVECGGGRSVLESAFEILSSGQAKLNVSIDAPAAVRAGRVGTMFVCVENAGTAAMAAPLLLVKASGGSRIRLPSQTEWSDGPLLVMGLGDSHPVGILRPGSSRRIPVVFSAASGAPNFSVSQLDDTLAVDWDKVLQSLSVEKGRQVEKQCEEYAHKAGSTWGELGAFLAREAAWLYSQGRFVDDVRELIEFGLRREEGFGLYDTLVERTDIAVDDGTSSVSFGRRAYRLHSGKAGAEDFGPGWRHTMQMSLGGIGTDNACFFLAGVPVAAFQRDGSAWRQIGGSGYDLAVDGEVWTLRDAAGTMLEFNGDGTIVSMASGASRLAFSYESGKLSQIVTRGGKTLDFSYDGDGHIVRISSSDGNVCRYEYDNGFLARTIYPTGAVEEYENDVRSDAASFGALTSVSNGVGSSCSFAYDASGRLVSVVPATGAAVGRILSYPDIGGEVSVSSGDGTAVGKVLFGDGNRRLKTIDAAGLETVYEYDAAGNQTRVVSPDGTSSDIAYDAAGRPVGVRDELGNAAGLGYDAQSGRLVSCTDTKGRVTSFGYADSGDVGEIAYPDGTKETRTYDAQGNMTGVVNCRGLSVSQRFDDAGRIVERDLGDSVQTFEYDSQGRMTAATDSKTGRIEMSYDDAGRLVRIVHPDGKSFDYAYDKDGHCLSRTDENGEKVEYVWSSDGEMMEVVSDALSVEYVYDVAGRVSEERRSNGTRTVRTYTADGKAKRISHFDADGKEFSFFAYEYDADGNQVSEETETGISRCEYNAAGQVTRFTDEDGNVEEYSYDSDGQRKTVTTKDGVKTYETDTMGRYVKAGGTTCEYDADGNLVATEDSSGRVEYRYDAANRVIGKIDEAGNVEEYRYDALGNMTTVVSNGVESTKLAYDPVMGNTVVSVRRNGAGGSAETYIYGKTGLAGTKDTGGNVKIPHSDAGGNTTKVSGGTGEVAPGPTVKYGPDNQPRTPAGSTPQTSNATPYPSTVPSKTTSAVQGVLPSTSPVAVGSLASQMTTGAVAGNKFATSGVVAQAAPSAAFNRTEAANLAQLRILSGAVALVAVAATAPMATGVAAVVGALAVMNGTWNLVNGVKDLNNAVFSAHPEEYKSELGSWSGFFAEHALGEKAGKAVDAFSSWIGVFLGRKLPDISKGLNLADETLTCINALLSLFDSYKEIFDAINNPLVRYQPFLPMSCDPNEVVGPDGIGAARYVRPGEWMLYTIYFENKSDASGDACRISVSNRLDSALDWNTLELYEVGFRNVVENRFDGASGGSLDTALPDAGYLVRTDVSLDCNTGLLVCEMRAWDETTADNWPEDPFAGILPPNDDTHRGEGHVTYRVRLRDDAPTGYAITNSATIVFDTNDPIETDPAWWNTVGIAHVASLDIGEDAVTNILLVAGNPFGELPTPAARKNWKFDGWYTGENGTGLKATRDAIVPDGEFELYANWLVDGGVASFMEAEVLTKEGSNAVVCVRGGSAESASSVKVYLTYNTAVAADIDLKNASIIDSNRQQSNAADSGIETTNLKFPLTLSWAAGEVGEKVITIPVKTDKAVEGDESFTLQLADAQGMELGEERVSTVTIRDTNDKTLKAAVTPYKPKKGEPVTTNSVTVVTDGSNGGFVAGTGEYTSGSKLTLTAEARPGWSFAGWCEQSTAIDGNGNRLLSTNPKWQIIVTNDAEYVAVFEKIPHVRGLADPADGGKVAGSGLCAAGKKVTLKATANKGFVFVGWTDAQIAIDGDRLLPNAVEYIATTPSLVIDRSAKPGKSTATSTTITGVDEDATYYACFITSDEDKNSIEASVDGWELEPWVSKTETHAFKTNIWAGVYLEWPIATTALSATTVKVAGLPAGLKFAAKPVTTKVGTGKNAVVVTNVPANTIYGAPTAASKTTTDKKTGKVTVTPSEVKVTVTTAGKSSRTYQIDTVVDALPSWAFGTFAGGWEPEGAATSGGQVSLTVSAAGKVSGKALGDELTYTLAAPYYSGFALDENQSSNFFADVTASWSYKAGNKTVKTNDVIKLAVQDNGIGGYAAVEDWFEAYTVNWKVEPWEKTAQSFNKREQTYVILSDGTVSDDKKYATVALDEDVVGRVTLKFTANGTASVAGEFVTGYNEKAKKYATVKASGSVTLVPVDDGHFSVFIYLTPKGLAPHARCMDMAMP